MTDHIAFHRSRELQERRHAEALAPGVVRNLHVKLADRHRAMVLSLVGAEAGSGSGDHQR